MKRTVVKVSESIEYELQDLFDKFVLEKKATGRSEATIYGYHLVFNKFKNSFNNKLTTLELNNDKIVAFQSLLQNEYSSKETINHYLRYIRTFVNWCYDNDFIEKKLKVKLVRGQDNIKEVYSEEELRLLLKKPSTKENFSTWRSWAVINWILGTGNRLGTIVELRMEDLDLKNQEVNIRSQKNKKISILPLDSTLVSVMNEYCHRCRKNVKAKDYVFPNLFGEKISVNGIGEGIREYNLRRGVNKSSAHALRHTYAKMYVMNGGDVFRLQKMLGHSTLEMSRHYVNLYGSDLKKGYDNISPLNNFNSRG